MARADRLVGLAKRFSDQLSRVPGASIIQQEYEAVEDAVLQELHQRMFRALSHQQEQRALPSVNGVEAEFNDDYVEFDTFNPAAAPSKRMERLLADALEQRPEQAVKAWANRVIDQLTADEARIIGAMSDGASHPIVSLAGSPSLTGSVQALTGTISSVGKAAKVKVRELVPVYIQQLQHLGLVDVIGEDSAHELEYQVLEVDSMILKATNEAKSGGYHRIRCQRRAIRLSDIGQRFWVACQTSEQAPDKAALK